MNDATLLADRARPAVRLERRLSDPPEVVWQALTEREQLRSWFPSDVIVSGGRWEVGAAITFPFPPELIDLTLTGEVLEVDEPTLRPLWAEATRRFPHGKDEEVVQQILEHRRLVAEALPTRYFAVEAAGELVAHAELYSLGGVGQVENVVTLDEYRNRGFARALVLRAAAASRETGNDLTFLVADADGWPQQLYEKLGFETVARYARYLRPA